MENEPQNENTPQAQETTFDIKITNGAAKLLNSLMVHFKNDDAKQTIALALALLDKLKDGEVMLKNSDGTIKKIEISKQDGQK